MNGKKLYVGSLSYSIEDNKLAEIFAGMGTVVSAKVICSNGQSKGFGFVEMSTNEEAKKAIDELNGTTHEGRAILVSEAKPETKRTGGAGGGGRGGFGGGRGGFGGGRGGFGGGRGGERRGGDSDRGGWR